MAHQRETEEKVITGSGFEKKGGYASPKQPVASLPRVPSGPAPGASLQAPSESNQKSDVDGKQSESN